MMPGTLPASAKKKIKPKVEVHVGSPRTIARQEWPPSITPEYVGVVDRGYACFADDMGRLAIVDLKREDNPQVIGELFGIGRKVVALSITQHRAFAVVQVEVGADTQYYLVTISLTPADDISIMSRITLGDFSEPSSVTSSVTGDVVVVGGLGLNGENQIVVYSVGKKKSVEPVQVSALVIEQAPVKMDIQDRQLVVLCGADNTDLMLVSLANPRIPDKQGLLRLGGSFQSMSRSRDSLVVAGQGLDRKCQVKVVSLKPSLKVQKTVPLPAVSEVLDLAAQKDQLLILATQNSRQAVIPLSFGKKGEALLSSAILLPVGNRNVAPRARIAVKDRDAYVASDWGGVQVLNVQKTGWQFSYSHTIPRLPASAIAMSGNKAVLACAELKLYNLADPKHPILESSTDINANVRSMVAVGRSIACLSADAVSLRSIERPSEVLASSKINGSFLTYDRGTGHAYVLTPKDTSATVSDLKLTDESLQLVGTQDYSIRARRVAVAGGRLLLYGLSELMFVADSNAPQQVMSRQMPNFAIRDALIKANVIYLSCVDERLRGFFIALAADKDGLPTISALELPLDACALAAFNNGAVVLGRSKEGKDKAVILELSDLMQPKIVDTFDVLDSASALIVKDNMAFIAGRGLEIISL